jgi:hypothetical protein
MPGKVEAAGCDSRIVATSAGGGVYAGTVSALIARLLAEPEFDFRAAGKSADQEMTDLPGGRDA